MTYDLIIGDYAYSSWSLRGWLLFEKFGLSAKTQVIDFAAEAVAAQLTDFAPARTVPVMRTPDGVVVPDSLAMAEELASRHPEAGHWPTDPTARAIARTLSAEMHSSYAPLRNACPMSLRTAYDWENPDEDVRADLSRIEQMWAYARDACAPKGPWLCGKYSVVDAFFAPVAARIAGYSLPVSAAAQDYVAAHLEDPAFRRWRAMGIARGATLPWYAQDHPQKPWPGPQPRAAQTTERTDSENAQCPYSGKPVTDFLEMDDRVFGFCNPFCRDKTVADPEAWPAFAKLL